jgi:hypothetical protein
MLERNSDRRSQSSEPGIEGQPQTTKHPPPPTHTQNFITNIVAYLKDGGRNIFWGASPQNLGGGGNKYDGYS